MKINGIIPLDVFELHELNKKHEIHITNLSYIEFDRLFNAIGHIVAEMKGKTEDKTADE